MTSATKTRTRKHQQQSVKVQMTGMGKPVLWITKGKDSIAYLCEAMPHDYGRAAFRLTKALLGGGEGGDVYDTLIDGEHSHCECTGFARHGMQADGGKGCKHIAALTAALAAGKLQPAPKPQVEREPGIEDESKPSGCPCCGCSPEACDCWQDP